MQIVSIRKRIVGRINGHLAPIEDAIARVFDRPLTDRPVFIVGPPRSGTTLLFQLLTAHADVGYLSNLHNACWGIPSLVEVTLRPLRWRSVSGYRSHLGNAPSWLGVSETPNYWLRFFPERPHCLDVDQVPLASLERLRAAVGLLQRAFGRPVVFKTIVNTGRLQPIAAALPEALFLVVRREPIATATSLLEARWKTHGTLDRWWSLEPPGVETLRLLTPEEQVVEQVMRTYERIEMDRGVIGPERFLDVSYEGVCDDPRRELERIRRFAGLRKRRGGPPEPDRFRRGDKVPSSEICRAAVEARSCRSRPPVDGWSVRT